MSMLYCECDRPRDCKGIHLPPMRNQPLHDALDHLLNAKREYARAMEDYAQAKQRLARQTDLVTVAQTDYDTAMGQAD